MDNHPSAKSSRLRWADLDDSFSSTEAGFDTETLATREAQHPETEILLRVLKGKSMPITVYLNNLPFGLTDLTEVLSFVGSPHSQEVTASFILKDGKPSGKATLITSSREIAITILMSHGSAFKGRPVYMNLDGFFGRGKTYKNQLKPRKQLNKKPKSHLSIKFKQNSPTGKGKQFCPSVFCGNTGNSNQNRCPFSHIPRSRKPLRKTDSIKDNLY